MPGRCFSDLSVDITRLAAMRLLGLKPCFFRHVSTLDFAVYGVFEVSFSGGQPQPLQDAAP